LASLVFGLEAVLFEKCNTHSGNFVGGALGLIGLWFVCVDGFVWQRCALIVNVRM
jgi:hypothetical protein